ncbi:hypothetical protein DFA_11456 [Cavenderia fasciculata]|uniref:Uncharacterized protein n=1 Tax=Cavenderia fasciculata TaxID=261658 RepID=F4QD14_CACFS|nr:uncharacterized protein DFA_11456 [Cavenderia fasciculata]EGG13695.1 hypothetical protein DFA_11456 [Cavenderia fasciculata]|eukprot:XP_004350399.1 hypothetical protein DFA_11456 [Cavenderia fasciculata]
MNPSQQQIIPQQPNQPIYPRVGVFWNLWEAAVPPMINVPSLLAQLKLFAMSFGVLKQFMVLSDVSNAVQTRYYDTRSEFKKHGVPLHEIQSGVSRATSDRSEMVGRIWEFVFDNYEFSLSNGLHIILIDRKANEYSIVKSLKSRGIQVTTLSSPFPPVFKNNNQPSDSHSFFSEDNNLSYNQQQQTQQQTHHQQQNQHQQQQQHQPQQEYYRQPSQQQQQQNYNTNHYGNSSGNTGNDEINYNYKPQQQHNNNNNNHYHHQHHQQQQQQNYHSNHYNQNIDHHESDFMDDGDIVGNHNIDHITNSTNGLSLGSSQNLSLVNSGGNISPPHSVVTQASLPSPQLQSQSSTPTYHPVSSTTPTSSPSFPALNLGGISIGNSPSLSSPTLSGSSSSSYSSPMTTPHQPPTPTNPLSLSSAFHSLAASSASSSPIHTPKSYTSSPLPSPTASSAFVPPIKTNNLISNPVLPSPTHQQQLQHKQQQQQQQIHHQQLQQQQQIQQQQIQIQQHQQIQQQQKHQQIQQQQQQIQQNQQQQQNPQFDNNTLKSLFTVIQGLKDDGFRPTFKVILPRLGNLLGVRIHRSAFEKILEKAKNNNFHIDYTTKTIYHKDDIYGGSDPHHADKSHFAKEELTEFLQLIESSQVKVFPSRFNMVLWVTSCNLPLISKLKQGQIVELCQVAINEKYVSLDENKKGSKTSTKDQQQQ